MQKILLTGIPGSGKTTIGNYFQDKLGFTHINLEDSDGFPSSLTADKDALHTLINNTKKDLIITWGFGPDMPEHREVIELIVNSGYMMFWLDGNRKAAEKAYLKRGTVSKDLLDIQMARIEKTNIKRLFNPLYYNTFDEKGNFKDQEIIAKDILGLIK